MLTFSKITLSVISVITGIGGFIADFNETHVYNPRWPPHAKFHNGQTMSMGTTLGLLTLFILWRPLQASKDALVIQKERLQYATLVGSLYWVTQASALLYPGSLALDPEFGTGNPQLYLDAVLLSVIGISYLVGMREIGQAERAKSA